MVFFNSEVQLIVSKGGFGGHKGYDSHLLFTLSAIQLLFLYGRLDAIDFERTVQCKTRVQNLWN
jgi:geranylgeranyl transferase type-2 subunit beta